MSERSFLEPGSDDCLKVILYEIPGEREDVEVREFGKGEEFFCDDLVMFHIPNASSKLLNGEFPIPDRLASTARRSSSHRDPYVLVVDSTANQAAPGHLKRVAVVEEIVAEEAAKDIRVRASVRDWCEWVVGDMAFEIVREELVERVLEEEFV